MVSKRSKKPVVVETQTIAVAESIMDPVVEEKPIEVAHNEVLKHALTESLRGAPSLEAVMKNPWVYTEWLAKVWGLVN